jgi:hypothetical protein
LPFGNDIILTVIAFAEGNPFFALITAVQKPYIIWYFGYIAIECLLERCWKFANVTGSGWIPVAGSKVVVAVTVERMVTYHWLFSKTVCWAIKGLLSANLVGVGSPETMRI